MDALKEFEQACLKHLQGKHNQKRHGWRYTGDAVTNARSAMRGQGAGERGEYRKRAGMAEPKKVERNVIQSDLLPEGTIPGKTIRQYKNQKYEMERIAEKALSEANKTPENKLQTRNAEKELRQREKERLQLEENTVARREYRNAKVISESDIQLSRPQIVSTARKMEFLLKVNYFINGTLNPNQALGFDFSSASSAFKSLMDLLDRRYGSIRQRYSR